MSANSITEPSHSQTHSSTPEFAPTAPVLLRRPLAPRFVAAQVRPDVLVHVFRREAVDCISSIARSAVHRGTPCGRSRTSSRCGGSPRSSEPVPAGSPASPSPRGTAARPAPPGSRRLRPHPTRAARCGRASRPSPRKTPLPTRRATSARLARRRSVITVLMPWSWITRSSPAGVSCPLRYSTPSSTTRGSQVRVAVRRVHQRRRDHHARARSRRERIASVRHGFRLRRVQNPTTRGGTRKGGSRGTSDAPRSRLGGR